MPVQLDPGALVKLMLVPLRCLLDWFVTFVCELRGCE